MAGETDLCCCLDRNKPNFLIKVNLRFSTPSRPCVDSNFYLELWIKIRSESPKYPPINPVFELGITFYQCSGENNSHQSLFTLHRKNDLTLCNHELNTIDSFDIIGRGSSLKSRFSKINDNDISQNEIRQKILLVKYLSTMHKISSKFSPSEIQGWKNSILKLEKSILQSKQHGELSKLPLSFSESKYEEVHCFYYASFQKMETKRLIRITIFFQSLERFEKKRCSIFYLKTFQNIHFSILPRLSI